MDNYFLISDPTEDTVPKYSKWEARASLYVTIDILTHNDSIRHTRFEGETMETTGSLLVSVVYAIQYLHQSGTGDPAVEPGAIYSLADSFSFGEIRKIPYRLVFDRYCYRYVPIPCVPITMHSLNSHNVRVITNLILQYKDSHLCGNVGICTN